MLSPSKNKRIRALLRDPFQIDHMRPGQRQAVETLLRGRDLLCILPTGGGKSLCYQLPALMLNGPTLVISPLISLMQDQVTSLCEKRIPALMLSSQQSAEEQEQALRQIADGSIRLIYAAPERLANRRFAETIAQCPPAMIVIDEAHCVIQWGAEFRPAYMSIRGFVEALPMRPVLCAFTATADRKTQRQLITDLGLKQPRLVEQPLTRANLHYHTILTSDPDRWCADYARARSKDKGLIFCRTRVGTEKLAAFLRSRGINAACYHAGLQADERERAQAAFANGEIMVMTATSAFGMGVDIPDIRYVIHTAICGSAQDYVQQAGRAGRDGEAAACIQLITPYELDWQQRFLMSEKNRDHWKSMRRLLRIQMGTGCISAGLTRSFGQHSRRCGTCGNCLKRGKKQPVERIGLPALNAMKAADLRRWALELTRGRIAAERGCKPRDLLPDRILRTAARAGVLTQLHVDPEVWQRLNAVLNQMNGF